MIGSTRNGLPSVLEVGDRRVEAVEVLGRVGDQHRRRAQALGEVPVGAVEAEHVVDARLVGHEDLVGVERVDAQREAGLAQVGDHPGPLVEPVAVEREPEVDDVGAGVAVVLGDREDLVAVEARDVVDLGEDADVALAVARPRVVLPEPRSAGALRSSGPFSAGIPKRSPSTSTSPSHIPGIMIRVTAVRDLEALGDPVGGHQRGDRDLHDRDVVVERQVGAAAACRAAPAPRACRSRRAAARTRLRAVLRALAEDELVRGALERAVVRRAPEHGVLDLPRDARSPCR